MTLSLSLATALALLGLAHWVATDSAPLAAHRGGAATTNLAVIRAFYAAANHTLRTGDPTRLAPLVALDLLEHRDSIAPVSGRAGLVEPLLSLHAGFPTAQLVVDDLLAQADEVVARVHLAGVTSGHVLGVTLTESVAAWGDLDLFRLANGVIVEHWGGQASPVALRPLQQATLVLSGARPVLAARRLTFVQAEGYTGDTWHGPRLLYVETGQLVVTITAARGGPAVRMPPARGTPGARTLIGPGHTVTLAVGDALALPEGTTFAAGGTGAPVVCLELALQLGPRFVPDAVAGPEVQPLADNLPAPLPPGAVAVALGEVTLAPGVSLPLTTTTGATLIVTESGQFGLTMTKGGAWIQRGTAGTQLALGQLTPELPGLPATGAGGRRTPTPVAVAPTTALAAGDTAVIGANAWAVLGNGGATPLVLQVVTLTPDPPPAGTAVASPLAPAGGRPSGPLP